MPERSGPDTKHDARRGGHRAKTVFVVACSGFVLSMFYRVSATVIAPGLTAELQLTSGQLSLLSAIFFYTFGAVQIPLGLALDRFGPRRIMLLLSAVAVAGTVVFASAQSAPVLYLGRALLGLGMACNFMGGLTLMAVWFPANRFATMVGLLSSIGAVGISLAATPLALLSEWLGWRGAFLCVAGLAALQVLALWRFVEDSPEGSWQRRRDAPPLLAGLRSLLGSRAYWVISFSTFFRYGCFMALQGLWSGPYLMYGLGCSLVTTGNALLACSLGFIISLPVFGRLSDRTLQSRKYVVMPALFSFAALLGCLPFLPHQPSPWLLYPLFFALGVVIAPGQIMYAHIKELSPSDATGTALTGVNLFTMLGSAVMMQAGGLLMDDDLASLTTAGDFLPLWGFFAAGLGVAGVLYLTVPDTRPGQDTKLEST